MAVEVVKDTVLCIGPSVSIQSRQGKAPKRAQFWNSTAVSRGWVSWNSDYPTKALIYYSGNVTEETIGRQYANYPNVGRVDSDKIYFLFPTDTTKQSGVWKCYAEFE